MSLLNKSNLLPILIFIGNIISFPIAAPYLQGNISPALAGRGIDSVRVASLYYRTVTYTDTNGHFVLERPRLNDCPPLSAPSDTLYHYSVQLSSNTQKRTILDTSNKLHSVSLCDLMGRTLTKDTFDAQGRRFPGKTVSNGIAFLTIDGHRPERIVILDNLKAGHLSPTITINQTITSPPCETDDSLPLNDTIYFCKRGYETVALSNSELISSPRVTMHKKQWLASDIHSHTFLTDGSHTLNEVLANAFNKYGLDVYANSEHGGTFARDTNGVAIKNDPHHSAAPTPNNDGFVSRWYSLNYFAWPKVLGQRRHYPQKMILLGLEWNNPSHEHVSIGFINDWEQPDAVIKFEYQFDANDPDTSIDSLLKQNARLHDNAVTALTWMQTHYSTSSYCFINHPSRENSGPNPISMFRDFHNVAPTVFLGLEGLPGHHKGYTRGNYSESHTLTMGGADPMVAVVGGLWDALLGEGRRLWIIVNSDFHHPGQDFWPGEYAKIWSTSTNATLQGWLEGVRAGEMFAVHGDLISELHFSIDDGVHRATMGSDFAATDTTLTIEIRFKSPPVNNNGDSVRVNHIDLIQGEITGKTDPLSAAYNNPTNPSSHVSAHFITSDWPTENGSTVIKTAINCKKPTYFRLRGTSLPLNTPGEVDATGNPLPDETHSNESIAWRDIWFYSNPIFVYPQ